VRRFIVRASQFPHALFTAHEIDFWGVALLVSVHRNISRSTLRNALALGALFLVRCSALPDAPSPDETSGGSGGFGGTSSGSGGSAGSLSIGGTNVGGSSSGTGGAGMGGSNLGGSLPTGGTAGTSNPTGGVSTGGTAGARAEVPGKVAERKAAVRKAAVDKAAKLARVAPRVGAPDKPVKVARAGAAAVRRAPTHATARRPDTTRR